MDSVDYLYKEACLVEFSARTKLDCLKLFAETTAPILQIPQDDIYDALVKREDQGATGFEHGVAIPHARLKGIDKFVIGIATSKKPIDFDSVDGKKSRIFFTLFGPEEQTGQFLRLLAKISMVAKSARARNQLLTAKTKTALVETFLENIPGGIKEQPKGENKLLTIVLNDLEFLEPVSELLLEHGIRGASVVNSSGMRSVLSKVPLFADFFNFLDDAQHNSKTMTMIVAENQISSIVESIEELMGDLDTHTGAIIYATDIAFVKGSFE